jgi:transcriptional regulator with XRE-family HTH domain
MYPNLKLQIFKRGVRQNHLAKQMGVSDAILSKIIHGYREPSAAERRVLSAYLEADENWLFEKFEGEPASTLANAWLANRGKSVSGSH